MNTSTENELQQKYVIDTYNNIAEDFSDSRVHPWKSTKQFVQSLQCGTKCLEVGAGNGKNMFRDDINMIGIDSSENLAKIANEKGKNVIVADGTCLPFTDDAFDSSFSIAVLHHVMTDAGRIKFVKEMVRVTKVNGPIMIEVWATTDPKFNTSETITINNSTNNDRLVSFGLKNKASFNRYYHFFNEIEFKNLINSISYKNKTISGSIFFEMNNWIFIGTVNNC